MRLSFVASEAVLRHHRTRPFAARSTDQPDRPIHLSELGRVQVRRSACVSILKPNAPNGFPEDVEAVVRDNAGTLKFGTAVFEKE